LRQLIRKLGLFIFNIGISIFLLVNQTYVLVLQELHSF
jgi:hypothetical protein